MTNAFMSDLLRKMAAASRHRHKYLHLVAGGVEQSLETLFDDVLGFDLRRYDLVHRIGAALYHTDDPRPHRYVVAPGRFDADVLQRPERRIDARLLHMQADLRDCAVVANRLAAGIETGF